MDKITKKISCPRCNIQKLANVPGKFRCSRCNCLFSVDEANTVIVYEEKNDLEQKKESGRFIFIILAIGSIIPYVALIFYLKVNNVITLSLGAIFAGLIYEYSKLAKINNEFFKNIAYSSLISYLCFIPGKHEHNYNLINHISLWPYAFLIILIIFICKKHSNKIIKPLHEGLTLLYTISFYYWLSVNTTRFTLEITIILAFVGAIPALITLVNALTYIPLKPGSRLFLSIWNSIIMLVLSVDYLNSLYQLKSYESLINPQTLKLAAFLSLQFFLLGTCCIYIVYNFMALSHFKWVAGWDSMC